MVFPPLNTGFLITINGNNAFPGSVQMICTNCGANAIFMFFTSSITINGMALSTTTIGSSTLQNTALQATYSGTVVTLNNVNIANFAWGVTAQWTATISLATCTLTNNWSSVFSTSGSRVIIAGAGATIAGQSPTPNGAGLVASQGGLINVYSPTSIANTYLGVTCDTLASMVAGSAHITFGSGVTTQVNCGVYG